jgi:hypothetical protein
MPLWLEMQVLMLLTYLCGLGLGWLVWKRKG